MNIKTSVMFKNVTFIGSLLIMIILSGCFYPNQSQSNPSINPHDYIIVVQSAVDRYMDSYGVLPIKNSDSGTPEYQKYIIDFKRLSDLGFMSQIPPNAFEEGGNHLYVLVDVEVEPTVKLLDIVTAQQAIDVQKWVEDYMHANGNQIPNGIQIADHWYAIDFEKMKKDRVQARSPYSVQYLSYLVHSSGRVAIDYAPDIMKFIQEHQINRLDEIDDLRSILLEYGSFVPVHSYPYQWQNDQPMITDHVRE